MKCSQVSNFPQCSWSERGPPAKCLRAKSPPAILTLSACLSSLPSLLFHQPIQPLPKILLDVRGLVPKHQNKWVCHLKSLGKIYYLIFLSWNLRSSVPCMHCCCQGGVPGRRRPSGHRPQGIISSYPQWALTAS